LVTAHSEKFVHIWDLQKTICGNFDPISVTESPLKYATSTICAFADGKGYAIASIEGRCGIVNINLNAPETKGESDFCFKCHRQENATTRDGDVYTINSISFNKIHNTFVTSG
jgi:hypothetical protein